MTTHHYLADAVLLLADPYVLLVLGSAVFIYAVVSAVSHGTRKLVRHVVPRTKTPAVEAKEGEVSSKEIPPLMTDQGSGDSEKDSVQTEDQPGLSKAAQCTCTQTRNQFAATFDEFDEFSLDKSREDGVVARIVRWASIAFVGQLMDSACSSIQHCEEHTRGCRHRRSVPPHSRRSPLLSDDAGMSYHSPSSRQSRRRHSVGGSPIYRGSQGDRRESGYHSNRRKHQQKHQHQQSLFTHPDLVSSNPTTTEHVSTGSHSATWFGLWGRSSNKNAQNDASNSGASVDSNDPICKKAKCKCSCRRRSSQGPKLFTGDSGLSGSRGGSSLRRRTNTEISTNRRGREGVSTDSQSRNKRASTLIGTGLTLSINREESQNGNKQKDGDVRLPWIRATTVGEKSAISYDSAPCNNSFPSYPSGATSSKK